MCTGAVMTNRTGRKIPAPEYQREQGCSTFERTARTFGRSTFNDHPTGTTRCNESDADAYGAPDSPISECIDAKFWKAPQWRLLDPKQTRLMTG